MVGPASSQVAKAEIPITNAAGLLECSPANTDPGLTKPRDGALDLRVGVPDRINFIRTAPADDIQGPALASFVFRDLGAKSNARDRRRRRRAGEIADDFSAAYQKLGGEVVRRALNQGADPASVLGSADRRRTLPRRCSSAGSPRPAPRRSGRRWSAAGHGAVPFVSWDGIQDGSGADQGSFIQPAGPAAVGLVLLARLVRATEGRLRRRAIARASAPSPTSTRRPRTPAPR